VCEEIFKRVKVGNFMKKKRTGDPGIDDKNEICTLIPLDCFYKECTAE